MTTLRTRVGSVKVFLLSGIADSVRKDLARKIHLLGGKYFDLEDFKAMCTHVVCGRLSRSEKFLGACATGKWVLHPDYVQDSYTAGCWLDEEQYEWCDDHITQKYQVDMSLALAARRWRFLLGDVSAAFTGWKVAVIASAKKSKVIKRLLISGGAEVFNLRIPVRNPGKVADTIGYIFVSEHNMKSVIHLIDYGVLCIKPEFMGDFLIKDPQPDPMDYLVHVESLEELPAEVAEPLSQDSFLVDSQRSVYLSPQKPGPSSTSDFTPTTSAASTLSLRTPCSTLASDQVLDELPAHRIQSQKSFSKELPVSKLVNDITDKIVKVEQPGPSHSFDIKTKSIGNRALEITRDIDHPNDGVINLTDRSDEMVKSNNMEYINLENTQKSEPTKNSNKHETRKSKRSLVKKSPAWKSLIPGTRTVVQSEVFKGEESNADKHSDSVRSITPGVKQQSSVKQNLLDSMSRVLTATSTPARTPTTNFIPTPSAASTLSVRTPCSRLASDEERSQTPTSVLDELPAHPIQSQRSFSKEPPVSKLVNDITDKIVKVEQPGMSHSCDIKSESTGNHAVEIIRDIDHPNDGVIDLTDSSDEMVESNNMEYIDLENTQKSEPTKNSNKDEKRKSKRSLVKKSPAWKSLIPGTRTVVQPEVVKGEESKADKHSDSVRSITPGVKQGSSVKRNLLDSMSRELTATSTPAKRPTTKKHLLQASLNLSPITKFFKRIEPIKEEKGDQLNKSDLTNNPSSTSSAVTKCGPLNKSEILNQPASTPREAYKISSHAKEESNVKKIAQGDKKVVECIQKRSVVQSGNKHLENKVDQDGQKENKNKMDQSRNKQIENKMDKSKNKNNEKRIALPIVHVVKQKSSVDSKGDKHLENKVDQTGQKENKNKMDQSRNKQIENKMDKSKNKNNEKGIVHVVKQKPSVDSKGDRKRKSTDTEAADNGPSDSKRVTRSTPTKNEENLFIRSPEKSPNIHDFTTILVSPSKSKKTVTERQPDSGLVKTTTDLDDTRSHEVTRGKNVGTSQIEDRFTGSGPKRKPDHDSELKQVLTDIKRRKIGMCEWRASSFIVNLRESEDAPESVFMPTTATEIFMATLEDGFIFEALEYLGSQVTFKYYPQSMVISELMRNVLQATEEEIIANMSYKILSRMLMLHPPITASLQEVYLRALAGCNIGEDWQVWAEWNFISQCFSNILTSDDAIVVRNNRLLFKFILQLLQHNIQHFQCNATSQEDYDTRHMLLRIIWSPSYHIVFNKRCRTLVDVMSDIIQSYQTKHCDIEKRHLMEMLEGILWIIAMVTECCRVLECGNIDTMKALQAHQTSAFVHEISRKLIDLDVREPVLLENIFQGLRLPWLRVGVCQQLLNMYDDYLLTEEYLQDAKSLSLLLIVTKYVYLLPVFDVLPRTPGCRSPAKSRSKQKNNVHTTSAVTNCLTENTDINKQNIDKITLKAKKKNHKGETPLHLACIKNDVPAVKKLLKVPGIDVNATDNVGWTPLHEASNHGNIECVRELLKFIPSKTMDVFFTKEGTPCRKVDLLAANGEGITPLHDAVLNNQLNVCHLLLQHGGPKLLEAQTCYGYTPHDLAETDDMASLLSSYTHIRRRHNESQTLIGSQESTSSVEDSILSAPSDVLYQEVMYVEGERVYANIKSTTHYIQLVTLLIKHYISLRNLHIICQYMKDEQWPHNVVDNETKDSSCRGAQHRNVDSIGAGGSSSCQNNKCTSSSIKTSNSVCHMSEKSKSAVIYDRQILIGRERCDVTIEPTVYNEEITIVKNDLKILKKIPHYLSMFRTHLVKICRPEDTKLVEQRLQELTFLTEGLL